MGLSIMGEVRPQAAKQRRLIDLAIDLFLTEMAGPDRSREGYVTGGMESDTPDGVLQQRQVFSYAIGLRRAADLLNQTFSTLTPGRQDPAVLKMLDGAFARLSENGKLRLEAVLRLRISQRWRRRCSPRREWS